jgi:hypothetical protein
MFQASNCNIEITLKSVRLQEQSVEMILPDVESIPIRQAIGRMETVPQTNDIIESAREIGISFGD